MAFPTPEIPFTIVAATPSLSDAELKQAEFLTDQGVTNAFEGRVTQTGVWEYQDRGNGDQKFGASSPHQTPARHRSARFRVTTDADSANDPNNQVTYEQLSPKDVAEIRGPAAAVRPDIENIAINGLMARGLSRERAVLLFAVQKDRE